MTQLTTCAYCFDEEFEAMILNAYGVRVIDKTDVPYSVVFEGDREKLAQMYTAHWSPDSDEDILDLLSDAPTEIVFPSTT